MAEYDVLVKDVTIVDGSGKKAYKGSIGVKGDRVTALGAVKGDAAKVVDGRGLTAMPGFVDAHSHADWTLPWFPQAESYVMQGVTTFVGGQCGGSPAPLGEYIRVPRMLQDHLQELDPYKYYPRLSYYPLDQINGWMEEKYGWTLDWETMGGFFKKMEKNGISVNYAPLLGHGSVRTAVLGNDYKRHTTQQEQAQMHELIHQGMRDGCIGMSTGLDYDPDVFADHEEIVSSVALLKEYGGVYCPHWRRTGRRRGIAVGHVPNEKITALMECVDVYNRTGVRLHFAHLSTGWDIRPAPPEELEHANLKVTIDMITRDSRGELDITWDAIPQLTRGGFEAMRYLCSLYEPWLRELGGREQLAKWFRLEEFREEVKEAIRRGKWYMRESYSPVTNPKWADNIYVIKTKAQGAEGKSIAQIAAERGRDPWDTWMDVIAEDPESLGATGQLTPSPAYLQYWTHPKGMVGLDTSVFDTGYERKEPPYTFPGINTFNAFPMFITKYVRDGSLFTLEEAAQKTSTMAARVHNLEGRGVIKEGSYADLVLLDIPGIRFLSDETETRRHPEGVEYVLVNGEAVVEKGKHTGRRPGRVLKRA